MALRSPGVGSMWSVTTRIRAGRLLMSMSVARPMSVSSLRMCWAAGSAVALDVVLDMVRGLVSGLDVGAVSLGHREEDHDREDGGEEQEAGAGGAEAKTTLGSGRGEVVTNVGAQWAGQDVGQPEAQHR